jgi:hypothetical protein
MKISQMFYLLSFFAPIAFLLGYIAGAPRPVVQRVHLDKIDPRPLPSSDIDFYRHESSMVVADTHWLQPNSPVEPK